jgi:hypothetical protein
VTSFLFDVDDIFLIDANGTVRSKFGYSERQVAEGRQIDFQP